MRFKSVESRKSRWWVIMLLFERESGTTWGIYLMLCHWWVFLFFFGEQEESWHFQSGSANNCEKKKLFYAVPTAETCFKDCTFWQVSHVKMRLLNAVPTAETCIKDYTFWHVSHVKMRLLTSQRTRRLLRQVRITAVGSKTTPLTPYLSNISIQHVQLKRAPAVL